MKSRACAHNRCGGCEGTVYVPVENRPKAGPDAGLDRVRCDCGCAHDRVVTNQR
jgi:hypothetical protein